MIKPIRISSEHDKVFFWSDMHIGHDRDFIYPPRGFKSIQEHDETLIARWNQTVPSDGIIFHLGDIMALADASKFWGLVRKLGFGTLYCLWGNHVSGQKQAYQEVLKVQFPNAFPSDDLPNKIGHYEIYPLWVDVDGNPDKKVCFLPEYVEVHAKKVVLTLCHYPISSWHHIGSEAIHCHGHTHNNLREKLPFRFDVGVEAQPRPVSLVEILRLTRGQTPAKVDHH